jgi:signal transduction histidine kinase
MNRLPSLWYQTLCWQLPLSVTASNALVQALLCSAVADQAGVKYALQQLLLRDPPVFVWAVLSWTKSLELNSPLTLQFRDLVRWLEENLQLLISSADPMLRPPSPASEARLESHRGSLPEFQQQEWKIYASHLLETCGPPVPQAWKDGWPSIVNTVDAEEFSPDSLDGEAQFPSLNLLARQLNELQRLRDCFSQELEQQKRNAIYQLAYGLSHEINNPLSNIFGRAESLRHLGTSPNHQRHLLAISEQVKRAHEMIADLMYVARPPQPVLKSLDLSRLVQQVCDEFLPLTVAKHVRFIRPSISSLPPVRFDAAMIADALRAVLHNSLQAVESQGVIALHLDLGKNRVRLRVQDNGRGLTAADRMHAFDPFYCGREAGRGLGMGLCKAERIMQIHRGSIAVSSAGVGCVVTMWLPRNPQVD